MARAGSTQTFETPDGREFWIRRVLPGKPLPGSSAGWPPHGWVCAPKGVEHDLNATRPTIKDAVSIATGIGVDQPWIASISAELEQKAGAAG